MDADEILSKKLIKNIKNIADVKNKDIKKITACLLDRPRHKSIIEELIRLNVNLKLITDGDVSGALLVTDQKHDVDVFLGIGGGPEGVLAASALDAFGCKFQGRFLFKTDKNVCSLACVNTLSQVILSNHLNTFSALPKFLLR